MYQRTCAASPPFSQAKREGIGRKEESCCRHRHIGTGNFATAEGEVMAYGRHQTTGSGLER